MGPDNNVGLENCWIMECLLPYLCMVTVPYVMVALERMLDYRGVGLERFHCTYVCTYLFRRYKPNELPMSFMTAQFFSVLGCAGAMWIGMSQCNMAPLWNTAHAHM